MGNIFQMAKQAMAMQKQMKQVQKELSARLVEYEVAGGAIKVIASADMNIKQIKVAPTMLIPDQHEKISKLLTDAVNGALEKAKKDAAEQMAKIAGGGGLSGLMDLLK